MKRTALAATLSIGLLASLLAVASPPATAAPILALDLVVAVRGTDNAVWVRVDEGDTPETTFSGWQSLGGQTNLAPAVSPNNVITIRGVDGATWYRTRDDFANTWGPWTSLGGQTNSTPVANRYGDVYIRGLDGAVWFRYSEGSYGPWTSLGGNITGSPVVSGEGLLVVRGADDVVYYNEPIEAAYVGWVSTGGRTTSAPTLYRGTTYHTIGLRGLDGAAWFRNLDAGTLAWTSGWLNFGGITAGPPVIINVEAVRGTDNVIYVKAPAGWTSTDGRASSDPSTTRVGLVARGLDGAPWVFTPGTSTWSSLGGSTPSAPAATPRPAEPIG